MKILLISALLPPLCVLLLVYALDRREKEPVSLLLKLFFKGVVAVLPIIALELIGDVAAQSFTSDEGLRLFMLYFIIPGFVEEGMKYRALKKHTWNDPNFNSRFDAIVYAVFVSLGFAAVENVEYVLTYGMTAAVSRALLAIPGHMSFAVIMGHYYAKAKQSAVYGYGYMTDKLLRRSWLTAAVLHGLYDYLLMAYGGAVFGGYFLMLILLALRLLFRGSRKDGPII